MSDSKRYPKIPNEEMINANNAGLLVEGTKGGLVLGRYHETGGVNILSLSTDGEYYHVGEMEGYEFIVNAVSTKKHMEELNEINNEFNGHIRDFENYDIDDKIPIIDCRPEKFIVLSHYRQFIINRHSTKKYINRLVEINYL